jgi:hypothetical protein
MKKLVTIILLLLIIILAFSCKKGEKAEYTAPMDITGFGALKKAKDSFCIKNPYNGFFLANNTFVIVGKHFGESGNVDLSDIDIDVQDIDWTDTKVTITTSCDDYKILQPIQFLLTRDDDDTVSTTEKLVTDLNGYVFGSPIFHLVEFMKTKGLKAYEDFHEDFQNISYDWIPEINDIVMMKDGSLRVVTEIAENQSNGQYRKIIFYTKGWDCHGREDTLRNYFYALFSQGDAGVQGDLTTPIKYLQL